MKVTRSRRRSAGMADCEQCNDLSIEASRDEAMKHAGERGHVVHFIVEDTSVYDGRRTTGS